MSRLFQKPTFVLALLAVALLAAACGGATDGGGDAGGPGAPRPQTFAISGRVVDLSGDPVQHVKFAFSTKTDTAWTDGEGRWTMDGFDEAVMVSPALDGYKFYPQEMTVYRSDAAEGDVVFTAVSTDDLAGQCTSGDRGSETDPCVLETIEQLQMVAFHLDGHYALGDDIAAHDTQTWFDGRGFLPIGDQERAFSGTFDGRGHVVEGLYIHRPDTDFIGLFGHVDPDPRTGPAIKGVGLTDAAVHGHWWVGGLVGMNRGYVADSYATGRVKGKNQVGGLLGTSTRLVFSSHSKAEVEGEYAVGGLVGSSSSSVRDSYSPGNVIGEESVGGLIGSRSGSQSTAEVDGSYSTGDVRGSMYVGGLIGFNGGGQVLQSYSRGAVIGTYMYVGGLAGANGGQIINSYSLGSVEGGERVGGLVGENRTNTGSGLVNNSYAAGEVLGGSDVGGLIGLGDEDDVDASYWDMDEAEQSTSPGGGTGRTTQEMRGGKTPDTFVGWDEDVWDFDGGTYPVLKPIIRGGA